MRLTVGCRPMSRWVDAPTSIDDGAVDATEQETARYYDAEEGREDRRLDPRRIAARERFVDAVRAARPTGPVLEIGTGPGRDALALAEAGLQVIGLDRSVGHASRAAARGVTAIVGSARSLPFARGGIGALWSMSTLMHIPHVAIDGAMHEIARVLAPGAPVAIGVWGGPDLEHLSSDAANAPRRLFSRRSEARWRTLLGHVGRLDDFEVWAPPDGSTGDDDEFRYHLAFVTAHA
jgi:SAM-dependent methyltransferase